MQGQHTTPTPQTGLPREVERRLFDFLDAAVDLEVARRVREIVSQQAAGAPAGTVTVSQDPDGGTWLTWVAPASEWLRLAASHQALAPAGGRHG